MALTEADENFIKNNRLLMTGTSMAEQIGVGRGVVERYLRQNGLGVTAEQKITIVVAARAAKARAKTDFTPQEDDELLQRYLDTPVKRLAKLMGRGQLPLKRRMLQLGLIIPKIIIEQRKKDSQLKPGNIPVNKDRKNVDWMTPEQIERVKATQFKKGHLPHQTKPTGDGTIVVRKDKLGTSHQFIRKSLGKWVHLRVVVWEEHFGPVPPGKIVVHKNFDSMNCKPDNLMLLTRAENMERNTIHRYPPEVKTAIRTVAKLNNTIKKLKDEK